MTSAADGSCFAPTRWTLVERTRGDSPKARAALSELCAAYCAPVAGFLQRSGHGEDAAREEEHGFFAHLLARDALGGAEPERGRFRSYLLGALKHFLAREHERAQRAKRGGGAVAVPLDAGTDTSPRLKPAIATPLIVIALNSFAGLAGHLRQTTFDWRVAGMFLGVAIAGMLAGRHFSGRVAVEHLRRAFAWFVLAVAVFVVAKNWAVFS